jgi:hypothetical protein
MNRQVTLRLGEFTSYALSSEGGIARGRIRSNTIRALRYYLSERDTGREGRPCPAFLDAPTEGGVEVELAVDGALWSALESKAERQGVPPAQLAEHAALDFAASRDTGRLTQSIVDDLDD